MTDADHDELIERLNTMKDGFIAKHGQEAYRKLHEKHAHGDLDDKLSRDEAKALIEELEEEL